MVERLCAINEIRSYGESWLLHLPQLSSLDIQPGQYMRGILPESDAILPVSLFAASLEASEGWYRAPVISGWEPGRRLLISGPFGHGFHLPASARFVAVNNFYSGSLGLLPLVGSALRQNAAVTWYGENFPADLPAAVEVLPLSQMQESFLWADYIALECLGGELSKVKAALGFSSKENLGSKFCEVLVHTPMPCAGISECGVCGVRTTKGYQHACKDGPVFSFDLLDPE